MRVVAGIAVLLVMLSSIPGVVSTITSLSGSGITKPHFRAIQCHTTPPSVQSTIGFGLRLKRRLLRTAARLTGRRAMERQLERCCGLDVHKETIAACVRLGGRTRLASTFRRP
jgi:hypothetical protein